MASYHAPLNSPRGQREFAAARESCATRFHNIKRRISNVSTRSLLTAVLGLGVLTVGWELSDGGTVEEQHNLHLLISALGGFASLVGFAQIVQEMVATPHAELW